MSKSGTTPARHPRMNKRGAFINGVWHCDCDPRLPAEKFQTKNGGPNHGRWFYTCQKPNQPDIRCKFFLWADDAKVREESAVLNNSRSEPLPPQTPKRKKQQTLPQMPTSKSRLSAKTALPTKPSPEVAYPKVQEEEEYEWSSSADEELSIAAQSVETPRKTPRTANITSPSKSAQSTKTRGSTSGSSTLSLPNDDPFISDSRSELTTAPNGLLSPSITPSHPPSRIQPVTSDSLRSQILSLLTSHDLPTSTLDNITSLVSSFELRTAGITKGRDLARVAVQSKERRIAELQSRITGLEQELETSRSVVAHMKMDIAASPKAKGRDGGGGRRAV